MGFFGLIKSIEDLLYEIITWLVFYPRTLWRVIRHPIEMTRYSEQEQDDAPQDQYTDTLSPPLFLMLSILISHAAEGAAGVPVEQAKTVIGKLLTGSEEMVLLFRSITFSLFPLMYALAFVKRSALDLDRRTLRGPFFSQCYVAALFALAISAVTILIRQPGLPIQAAALALLLAAMIGYIVNQTMWLHLHLPLTWPRAALLSVVTYVKSLAFIFAISFVFMG